jgi:two-component system, OmpR family, sensor kinase
VRPLYAATLEEVSIVAARGNPDLEALGQFVRERRQALGLTQTQFAERVGWVQERVSLIENAKYGLPSLPALVRMAESLDVSLAVLLDAVGYGTMVPNDSTSGTPATSVALQYALQQLLTIETNSLKEAMDQASDIVAQAMGADKVDAFMHDPTSESLVAMGTSNTSMGHLQKQLGLDFMPIANGGRTVEVFQKGKPYSNGHADEDPEMLVGVIQALKVRSMIAIPLRVDNEIQGVLSAESSEANRFGTEEEQFFDATARWVAMVAHRTQLSESLARGVAEEARRLAAEELITLLAHDLGNALTPIKGRLQMLARRSQREGRDRDLTDVQDISRSVGRVQRIISDLLDVSRLEEGIFSLSCARVDLVALIEEVVQERLSVWSSIIFHRLDELVIDVDASRISQVLENLINNATHHAPEGSAIVVGMKVENRHDGSWAVVTVQDEGPGIPPDVMPRLFTRFASGPHSTGLGLGLYLARSIAEAHGGTLTVESTGTSGTTFSLALPMTE